MLEHRRREVTEMFLLFVFTGLDDEPYERHAYGTGQPWVFRGPVRQALGKRKERNGNAARPSLGRLRGPSSQGRVRL